MLLLLLSPAKTINAGAKVVAGAPKPTVRCHASKLPRSHGFGSLARVSGFGCRACGDANLPIGWEVQVALRDRKRIKP